MKLILISSLRITARALSTFGLQYEGKGGS